MSPIRLPKARLIATTALVGALAGALILAPASGWAQDTVTPIGPSQAALPPAVPPQAAPVFDQAQLQSMLAPVALYPDPLLSNMLMAAAYPDEVAAADQWVHDPANAGLTGEALNNALAPIDWDPSVKSLAPFPQVLDTMAQHMDWTQQLGQAFVVQQADVMNAVQSLRERAQADGNLRSSPQLAVGSTGGAITIEPANPAMVYVPMYDPAVVYGPWAYPVAPVVIYPPRVYAAPIVFGVGFAIVAPLWGWNHWDWAHRRVFVEPARVNVINARLIEEHHRERVVDDHWHFDRGHDHGFDRGRAGPEPASHASVAAPRAARPHPGPSHASPAAVHPQGRPQGQDQRHAPQAPQHQWHAPAAQSAPHRAPPSVAAVPHANAPRAEPHPQAAHAPGPHAPAHAEPQHGGGHAEHGPARDQDREHH
ncbi:MAG TPA: DUF3300 domain-containing protein [Alphaproteobacteria bacterium]|nr:DUF3300 domain-containing protein [Alphaproteobacteria bacterium]